MYHRRMEGPVKVGAFVLAGGKSRRMGADKAFLEFTGVTLLARALAILGEVAQDVRILGSHSKFASYGSVVEDVFYKCGPLGGIHAALRISSAEWNLMLAVDMPLVTAPLLRFIVSRAEDAGPALAIVPRCAGRWQPLCAVYRRGLCGKAEDALRAGRNKIGLLLEEVPTRAIEEDELQRAGFSAALFDNLNTPEDLERLRIGMGAR